MPVAANAAWLHVVRMPGLELGVCECPFCGAWHLTRRLDMAGTVPVPASEAPPHA